jgi:hypothetical protein
METLINDARINIHTNPLCKTAWPCRRLISHDSTQTQYVNRKFAVNRFVRYKAGLGGNAKRALAQIHDRGYAKPYTGGTRPVYLIGAVFGAKGQGVVDWKMEINGRGEMRA